jgi:glycosyltransferase involved in cell wall biosynthesis
MAAKGLPNAVAVCTIMSMAVAPFLPKWMPLVVGTQQISALEQSSGRLNVNLIEPPVDLQHNGSVDAANIDRFRQQWGLGDLPLVVCVSRLVPELKSEGIFTAIDVAGTLADTLPFQLLIVGEGKARPAMEEAAAQVNQRAGRRAVVLTGELTDPRPAYAAADVVLGMGGSALRSLAFAKPLIVQGERGYFRTLTPESVEEFRWQGWYGNGEGSEEGMSALDRELSALLVNAERRREMGAFGRQVVEEFSLERAARRQLTIYRDAQSAGAEQRRNFLDTGRSILGLAHYYAGQRLARWRGRQRADDFNANPVAQRRTKATDDRSVFIDQGGPILYFPGVGWDTLAGTDRQLATALAQDCQIIWVDTPHSILRRADRSHPAISQPIDNVVRLRASTFAGVQRPFLRQIANRRRAHVARLYLAQNGLSPRAVIASTTAPMLALTKDIKGVRIYYATDDFVEAASLWGVSRSYLGASRERNLRAADVVMAVTQELARHLQRGPEVPRWLPNGADVDRFRGIDAVVPAEDSLQAPIAGVVGQFNSRTDLSYLEAVQRAGVSLLLVGPRWFVSAAEDEAFDTLTGMPGVHWVGELPRDRLAPYLRMMDVGLTPYRDSMFNRRSYPLKTVEYLAAGVPVVTTDVASLSGLSERYVCAAEGTSEFSRRVEEIARAERVPADIRRSVESEGWDSRALQLLAWLRQETRSGIPVRTDWSSHG